VIVESLVAIRGRPELEMKPHFLGEIVGRTAAAEAQAQPADEGTDHDIACLCYGAVPSLVPPTVGLRLGQHIRRIDFVARYAGERHPSMATTPVRTTTFRLCPPRS
jgi:hypothetical protein